MTSENLYKISSVLFNLVLLVFLIIPFSTEFSPLENTGNEFGFDWDWIDIYVLKSVTLTMLFCPLYFLWGSLSIISKSQVRKIIKIVALSLSGFYFFYGSLVFNAPIQDFSPNYGTLILFLFFPLLSLNFYLDFHRKNYNVESLKWVDILDA